MSTPLPIPAGALFTVTAGEYSSYHVRGVFRAKAEIDVERLKERFAEAFPMKPVSPNSIYKARSFEADFLAYVFRLGLLEPLDTWTLHIGDTRFGEVVDVEATFEEGTAPQ